MTSLARRITKLLDRRGLGPDSDPEESDSLRRDEPWLGFTPPPSPADVFCHPPGSGRGFNRQFWTRGIFPKRNEDLPFFDKNATKITRAATFRLAAGMSDEKPYRG